MNYRTNLMATRQESHESTGFTQTHRKTPLVYKMRILPEVFVPSGYNSTPPCRTPILPDKVPIYREIRYGSLIMYRPKIVLVDFDLLFPS